MTPTLLRFHNADGTSKDWCIEVLSDGRVSRRFGKTGKGMQETITPVSQVGPNPVAFAQVLVSKKMQKGYVVVELSPEMEQAAKTAATQARAEQATEALCSFQVNDLEGFVLF